MVAISQYIPNLISLLNNGFDTNNFQTFCEASKGVIIVTSKFGEFISPAEVALVCLKFIFSFIKFCSLVTNKLWLICAF